MRLIDSDALIADLEHDIKIDVKALDWLDCLDPSDTGRRDIIQFDKDCKQNAIDLLRKAPTAQPEQCEWIPKEVENVPYGLIVECSKCKHHELIDNALYHKYCPNCGRKVITEWVG